MNVFLATIAVISLFIYNAILSVFLFLIPQKFRRKKEIAGQKVLITGAGNGLGRQLAVNFSKHSTFLILLDIDKKALEETARLVDSSSRVFIYECDVTNRKMVYAVAEKIKDDVGDIDILINNAGIVSGKSLIDLPDEKIVKTMEVNVISHFWICKSFLPSMMARNNGHIVTIASVAGHTGGPRLTDYCASKFAAVGFSESLEMELKTKNLDGIKVTIVCPSFINTGLFYGVKSPLHEKLSPEYVSDEIVAAVREEKETIFLPSYHSYFFMWKSLIPRWLWILGMELTHSLTVMDDYKGKPNTNSINPQN